MKKLSPVFLPTIPMTVKTTEAVVSGELPVRTGQWVRTPNGLGQFVIQHDGSIFVSYSGKGDGFEGRTQRFARAVWHQKRKHLGVVPAVLTAPRSTRLGTVKQAVQKLTGYAA